ncbi:ectonucleotide pyrophosphatase/phosphodiesterase [Terriglobus saanensis]|nr:ectonucleotide pyrophosphatase/phosphodiesterase [Terriglobus saanensis]
MRRLLALVLACTFAASAQVVLHTEQNPLNTPAQQRKHYVVLVSLDGFRYDYAKLHDATHLLAMGKSGASTPQGMRPSYPSITFPNHTTLVTGLLPEHNGILWNSFYDPATHKTYEYKKNSNDGSFYSGTPLWSLAEENGMRSAAMFWPGSEAKIAGHRPTFWAEYLDKYDGEKRIDQVITWLQLPPSERPHFITLYFADTDHGGHDFGVESPELVAAVHHVDVLMGELSRRLRALHLSVDLIVTADHGMIDMVGPVVTLSELPGMAPLLAGVRHEGILLYPETEAQREAIYEGFRAHPDPRFTAYRLADTPASLEVRENPRLGDPYLVFHVPTDVRFDTTTAPKKRPHGEHGYDPLTMPEMKAIFFAEGPDIRKGVNLPTFQNTAVYDFVAKLLGLTPAPNDGSLAPLLPALKHP